MLLANLNAGRTQLPLARETLVLAQKIRPKALRAGFESPLICVWIFRGMKGALLWSGCCLYVTVTQVGTLPELPLESFVSAKESSIHISSPALCLLNTPSERVSLWGNAVTIPMREGSNQSSMWLKAVHHKRVKISQLSTVLLGFFVCFLKIFFGTQRF